MALRNTRYNGHFRHGGMRFVASEIVFQQPLYSLLHMTQAVSLPTDSAEHPMFLHQDNLSLLHGLKVNPGQNWASAYETSFK